MSSSVTVSAEGAHHRVSLLLTPPLSYSPPLPLSLSPSIPLTLSPTLTLSPLPLSLPACLPASLSPSPSLSVGAGGATYLPGRRSPLSRAAVPGGRRRRRRESGGGRGARAGTARPLCAGRRGGGSSGDKAQLLHRCGDGSRGPAARVRGGGAGGGRCGDGRQW
jgi:hypothetical protein